MGKELIKWDKIRYQIEEAKDIETLTGLKNKLRAYQILAEQSKQSQEVQAKIAIYKARADRKCGEWLKDNIPKHNEKNELQPATRLKDINVSKTESSRLQKIADIPEDKFEGILQEAEVETKRITNNMLVNIAKEADRTDDIQEQKENIKKEKFVGNYDVIMMDVPWPYGTNYSTNGRRVANPYPEMSIDEIKKLEIPAKENSILFFWTTHKFLKDSFEIIENYGFEHKGLIVWNKQKMGMGEWLRMQCEFCLLAIKGKPLWDINNMRDIIDEPRREHSRKPEALYEIINKKLVGKKLDYFSREERRGWDNFGNQKNKFNVER